MFLFKISAQNHFLSSPFTIQQSLVFSNQPSGHLCPKHFSTCFSSFYQLINFFFWKNCTYKYKNFHHPINWTVNECFHRCLYRFFKIIITRYLFDFSSKIFFFSFLFLKLKKRNETRYTNQLDFWMIHFRKIFITNVHKYLLNIHNVQ